MLKTAAIDPEPPMSEHEQVSNIFIILVFPPFPAKTYKWIAYFKLYSIFF